MVWNEAELKAQARKRYEHGRLSRALEYVLAIAPLVGLALLASTQPLQVLIGGVFLISAATLMHWRGMGWERGIWPGLLTGGSVGAMAIVAEHFDSCCVGVESKMCLVVCFVGGALAGAIINAYALRTGRGRVMVVASGIIAALAASLGCIVGGLVGLAGMLSGLIILTAPALVFIHSRA